jgi:predicted nucleic acid-binding protein
MLEDTHCSTESVKIKVYLDNCCYNRPFDTQNSNTVIFESSAKMSIQQLVVNQKIILAYSVVLLEETYNNPFKYKKEQILGFLSNAKVYVGEDKRSQINMYAAEIMKSGIKYMDAAHISAAIIAECDFFVTTDKKLLNYKSDRITVINPIDFIRVWESKNA